MRGPAALEIVLAPEAEQALHSLTRRRTGEQQLADRARIILLAAEGESNSEIARELKMSRERVRQWRDRWHGLAPIPLFELSVEERLEDLPRPGAPLRITADQRCQIEALACEAPAASGRPISQWTARELADEIIKRNIVETISPRHAARLFKRSLHSPPPEPLLAQHGERRGL